MRESVGRQGAEIAKEPTAARPMPADKPVLLGRHRSSALLCSCCRPGLLCDSMLPSFSFLMFLHVVHLVILMTLWAASLLIPPSLFPHALPLPHPWRLMYKKKKKKERKKEKEEILFLGFEDTHRLGIPSTNYQR